MWKCAAGVWGPLGFVAASLVASRHQPSYSHRDNHVSGLASLGERSAAFMVPGFLTLAMAQLVLPAPNASLRRLFRMAAATTAVAGVVRVSDPRCPQPRLDPDVTASDIGHGAASIATFALWTAMPILAARDEALPRWYRRVARLAIVPTAATLAAAGVTTLRGSSDKGTAQRAFLTSVFVFQAATALAATAPAQGGGVHADRGPATVGPGVRRAVERPDQPGVPARRRNRQAPRPAAAGVDEDELVGEVARPRRRR